MTIVANKTLCVRCTLLICCIACAAAHAYDSADVDTVTVVGTTALPGSDVSLDKLAGNFQSVNDQEFANSHSFDATEFFTRKVGSAFANDAQGNPLQHDLQVRGFVASPLLGSSQGISVFQDGVRVNEPFGDTVNWALIPDFAIGNINLLSGSNALFGLNTLGAAILVHTKNGFTHAGVTGELGFGSARRMSVESTAGGVVDQKAF
ncbi:MAG TPA: Plug domain-containing protein, partial [Steroidobacteraceae bacterium]|nr:Plug domain-containing protein [Steroidobacteraceae bacterium]